MSDQHSRFALNRAAAVAEANSLRLNSAPPGRINLVPAFMRQPLPQPPILEEEEEELATELEDEIRYAEERHGLLERPETPQPGPAFSPVRSPSVAEQMNEVVCPPSIPPIADIYERLQVLEDGHEGLCKLSGFSSEEAVDRMKEEAQYGATSLLDDQAELLQQNNAMDVRLTQLEQENTSLKRKYSELERIFDEQDAWVKRRTEFVMGEKGELISQIRKLERSVESLQRSFVAMQEQHLRLHHRVKYGHEVIDLTD